MKNKKKYEPLFHELQVLGSTKTELLPDDTLEAWIKRIATQLETLSRQGQLSQALYRLDVSEKKVSALFESSPAPLFEELALLVFERELDKARHRKSQMSSTDIPSRAPDWNLEAPTLSILLDAALNQLAPSPPKDSSVVQNFARRLEVQKRSQLLRSYFELVENLSHENSLIVNKGETVEIAPLCFSIEFSCHHGNTSEYKDFIHTVRQLQQLQNLLEPLGRAWRLQIWKEV